MLLGNMVVLGKPVGLLLMMLLGAIIGSRSKTHYGSIVSTLGTRSSSLRLVTGSRSRLLCYC